MKTASSSRPATHGRRPRRTRMRRAPHSTSCDSMTCTNSVCARQTVDCMRPVCARQGESVLGKACCCDKACCCWWTARRSVQGVRRATFQQGVDKGSAWQRPCPFVSGRCADEPSVISSSPIGTSSGVRAMPPQLPLPQAAAWRHGRQPHARRSMHAPVTACHAPSHCRN